MLNKIFKVGQLWKNEYYNDLLFITNVTNDIIYARNLIKHKWSNYEETFPINCIYSNDLKLVTNSGNFNIIKVLYGS